MATVIPVPGELAETARALLALADHPHQVRTVSNGTQFEVPDELADRYNGLAGGDTEPKTISRKRRVRAPRMTEEE